MGSFNYIIPLIYNKYFIIVCINLVLMMGWVDSPKFFCAFSETISDVAIALVHTLIPVPGCRAIFKTTEKGPNPPQTLDSLTHK